VSDSGDPCAAAGGEGVPNGHDGEPGDAAQDGHPADPGELLGEVRAIRRRARLARHAYWFPLVLFGVLTCASLPFYVRHFPTGRGLIAARLSLFLPGAYLGGLGLRTPVATAYYWLGAILFGIAATAVWYRWRGNRVGLRTPARGYLITGLVLLALALAIPLISGRGLGLPLIWPFAFVTRGTFPLVLIGLGLCFLAWAERSVALAVIAAVYLTLSLVASLYDIENVFYRLGWNLSPAASALPNVLLPALVLLLSGAGAWVVQRRQRSPAGPVTEG